MTRQTWFTADLHLGHENIIRLCNRPFDSVAEMNTALVDNWNSRVDDDDVVWVLGDYAIEPIAESLAITADLKGTKYLIAGDYDRCFHGYGDHAERADKLAEWESRYVEAGFTGVVTGAAIRGSGAAVTLSLRTFFGGACVATVGLCHFPMTGESDEGGEDRYAGYRPRKVAARDLPPDIPAAQPKFSHLLHGHVHNRWTILGSHINVGVDVWDFAPVPAQTVLDIIDKGMPDCDCDGQTHAMGSPGCILNGG